MAILSKYQEETNSHTYLKIFLQGRYLPCREVQWWEKKIHMKEIKQINCNKAGSHDSGGKKKYIKNYMELIENFKIKL